MKRTRYFGIRLFFGLDDPEEWEREWAKFSPAEKEQFRQDVESYQKQKEITT